MAAYGHVVTLIVGQWEPSQTLVKKPKKTCLSFPGSRASGDIPNPSSIDKEDEDGPGRFDCTSRWLRNPNDYTITIDSTEGNDDFVGMESWSLGEILAAGKGAVEVSGGNSGVAGVANDCGWRVISKITPTSSLTWLLLYIVLRGFQQPRCPMPMPQSTGIGIHCGWLLDWPRLSSPPLQGEVCVGDARPFPRPCIDDRVDEEIQVISGFVASRHRNHSKEYTNFLKRCDFRYLSRDGVSHCSHTPQSEVRRTPCCEQRLLCVVHGIHQEASPKMESFLRRKSVGTCWRSSRSSSPHPSKQGNLLPHHKAHLKTLHEKWLPDSIRLSSPRQCLREHLNLKKSERHCCGPSTKRSPLNCI